MIGVLIDSMLHHMDIKDSNRQIYNDVYWYVECERI